MDDQHTFEQENQLLNLDGWLPVVEWLPTQKLFRTRAAFDWFYRRNREEMIRRQAVIVRPGRVGNMCTPQTSKVVADIVQRESRQFIEDNSAA